MASFYAELHVEGHSYRVVRCNYSCHQNVDARGRVTAKVRHSPLQLVLDVPEDDALLNWANTPRKPLAGEVVFYDSAQRIAYETIAFSEGDCVQYNEAFESGADGDGSYVCLLAITAPTFELRAGGPAAVAAAVAATSTAGPAEALAAVAAAAGSPVSGVLRETLAKSSAFDVNDPSTYFVRPTTAVISPAVTELLRHTFDVTSRPVNDGPVPAGFKEAVMADLQALYDTKTGRKLLESLQASGKRIEIFYGEVNGAAFPNASKEYPHGYWPPAFYDEDGKTPGAGTAMGIRYNPFNSIGGEKAWQERPPGIGLAHELIHAEQAAHGRMRRGSAPNGGQPEPDNDKQPQDAEKRDNTQAPEKTEKPDDAEEVKKPKKQAEVHVYELETVGVPPYDKYPITENKIRAEWNPPQPLREHY
ncbi:type VI secretion system tube protein TssD [Hymenobacter terrenus]|uniref:type VI secretion system tube protein TssD n=1 Tax=Hymenobacter terrenus TaxID=1629124 RepID=UPI000619412C|nr:type VI secretion system tube protein TssD [Hymenobacter terrenus]